MTAINHLFWRFIYLLACWWIGLKPVLFAKEVNKTTILATLFLFLMPLLIDYKGFIVISKLANRIKNTAFIITLLTIILIGLTILDGGSLLNEHEKTLYGINLEIIWYILGIWVIFGINDWICLTIYPKEAKAQEHIQKNIRKVQDKILQETPLEKRISYHKNRIKKTGGVNL
ncbi:hypothetical protein M3644_30285 [Bacillus cereus]|uniref:hypothetical protein n=1 Tax=Bacillus cereus TaxID=1396 RepID=UPI0020403C8B|nr:hypothetical protein [Bacillus cereus]MCM3224020.1 hypothetical protein [Bacillus cereus]